MRRPIARILVPLLLMFVIATPAAAAPITPVHSASAGSVAGCIPWRIVLAPTDPFQEFTAIDGESARNFWAVGDASASPHRPTILRWDGMRWSRPLVEVKDGAMEDVALISSHDAWAVGERTDGSRTLVLHWDGSAWAKVSSPSPEPNSNALYGVSATSSSDAWAVGVSGYNHGLITHWDGRTWSVVPHPQYRAGEEFRGVLALAKDNVWAVGDQFSSFEEKPIIQHWDGSAWSDVRFPHPEGIFLGIGGSGPNDVWAVGSDGAPLIFRWNGTEWTRLGGILDRLRGELRGVSALTPDDVWVSGVNKWGQPVAAHWNGSTWTFTPVQKENAWFNTIKAFSHTEVWAGGGGITGIRAERFSGCP